MGNYIFPYTFADNIGIKFKTVSNNHDLQIYYKSLEGNHFIDCNCSRWDSDNYNVILETWLKKSDCKDLRDNITPGAVSDLYTILGKAYYYDMTWTGDNTLRLVPNPLINSNLYNMRKETLIFVKSITTSPIEGQSGWIDCKIEGFISGGSLV